MSVCRSCGAQIEWCRTVHKNLIPLDVGVVVNGNLVVSRDLLGDKVAAYVPPGDGDRVAHFVTCPNAKEHRRR